MRLSLISKRCGTLLADLTNELTWRNLFVVQPDSRSQGHSKGGTKQSSRLIPHHNQHQERAGEHVILVLA
jgi:hypothetical protein